MANLKGGSYDKQIKDAFHRVEALGTGRNGKEDHLTHSVAVAEKREMYLRDYKDFAEREGFEDKLNQTMTDQNIDQFLSNRLENLAQSTQEDYARGFNSMLKGLEEKNITIPATEKVFNDYVAQVKNMPTPETVEDRAIDEVEKVIEDIYSKQFESGVISEVQNELGLRVSEARELVAHPEKYIVEGQVEGLIGKGNHAYHDKNISEDLIEKISACENIPSVRTYQNHLPDNIVSHDFRHTYIKREVEARLESGMDYKEALKEVSRETNHKRLDVIEGYMKRA